MTQLRWFMWEAHRGKHVTVVERNEYIARGLAYLKADPECPSVTYATGDMRLTVSRNEEGGFDINDTKPYRSAHTVPWEAVEGVSPHNSEEK